MKTVMGIDYWFLYKPQHMSDHYIQSFFSGWYKKFPTNPTFKPSTVLEDMVAKGKLGVKSGEGFYKYDKTAKL